LEYEVDMGAKKALTHAFLQWPRSMLTRRRVTGPSATLVASVIIMNILRIGNTVILTRLLAPSDYGLMAIIMAIFFVITMVTDTGCQAFIVRHDRGLDRNFLDAIWTVHLLRGMANALVALILAEPLSRILGKPELAPLFSVAAISLAVDGAGSLSLLTALRNGMVRRLSVVDVTCSVIQLVAGLTAAWYLRNAWAMVIATIAQSVARAICSYALFPGSTHRIRFDKDANIELWRFSRMIAASSTLTLIISQIDRLVLARLFSLQQFGVYSIAGSLSNAPTTIAQLYSGRIFYPVIAETWRSDPDGLRNAIYGMRGSVFYAYLLAAGGLIGAAPLVIGILYDPRYAGAATYLQLLAITTAMVMLTKPMNDALVAIGHVRATLEINFVRFGWLIVAGVCGYLALGPFGIVVALSLIEVPAYILGATKLARLRMFRPQYDMLAFSVIAIGALLGLLASHALPMMMRTH